MLSSPLPLSSPILFHSRFKQDSKTAHARKPWYLRAMEAMNKWKPAMRTGSGLENSSKAKLRTSTSLRMPISFTRVCLCLPISSYNDVFWTEVPPRKSNSSLPRSRSVTQNSDGILKTTNLVQRRRVFRGKSLTDDVLMRRFVVEEAVMQTRRRDQMEFERTKNCIRKRKLGPSPLGKMAMAGEEVELI